MFDSLTTNLFSDQEDKTVKIVFRGRLKASSTVFQNSAVDNVSIIMCGF